MTAPLEELFESSLSLASTEKTLRQIPQSRGVLLLADENQRSIQILTASSLRRTALAKLSETRDQESIRKTDLRPIVRYLYFTPVNHELHCTWLYNRLVHLLFPEKSNELICLPPPHCVRINPEELWASFAPSTHPFRDRSAVYFGPFPTRKSADFFARTYNDVFALCRNRPLALGGKGRHCSYFQMGLCPAPCLQQGDQSQYRRTVLQALKSAESPVYACQEKLTIHMKTCAGQMQFEKAQSIKEQIEQLGKLNGSAYRWTRRMDTLKILHIAQGPKLYTAGNLHRKNPVYGGCLITSEWIERIPNFSLSSIPRFLDRFSHPSGTCRLISKSPAEHMALICLFLYKSRPPGLWLDLNEQTDFDEEMLKNAITQCFKKGTPGENQ